ncbi:major facilitator superfamily domain-containing protein [Pisolithus albus]|nr:major facilitator superfamily domain-containing protein [Pisolithus albus]
MPDKNFVTFCPTDVSNVQEPSPVSLQGPERERKLWRKIDLRLVPIISSMYLFSFMDRGNAKLEGLMTQLHLTGSQFNVALVISVKFKLFRRWLPGIMFAWGIAMTFMGLVKSYPQLAGMRFLLGMAEAGFYPGVVFYLSMWYPEYKLIYRIALFTGAAAVAGAFSGLLAYAIGFMNNVGHLEGWSWIFILQGLATIAVCLVGVFGLVDYPDTAKFLSAEEKRFIKQQRSTLHSNITCSLDRFSLTRQRSIVAQQVLSAFADWQVWSMALLLISFDVPVYGITFFLPFGYDTAISQLLTVPVYVGATISMISVAHFSDRMKIRFPFIIVSQLMGLAGYIILITDASTGVKYFGTFLVVIGTYSGVPCTVGWLANNLRGKYKRAGGMAIQGGIGNLGGIIASNIFQTRDEPRFILAFAIEIGFLCMGLIVTIFSAYAYHRANRARSAPAKRDGKDDAKYTVDFYVI